MWEVSIDYLQQQVHMFWGKVREVRIFLQGEACPPPRGPPLLEPPLGSLRPYPLPPHYYYPLLPPSQLRSQMPLSDPAFFGERVLLPCPLVSPLPPPPLPLTLLILLPCPSTPQVGQVCCLWGARDW